MKKTNVDLTTGGIIDKIIKIALPIMASQLFSMAYNLINMLWLSKLGEKAVAASGSAGMFLWLSFGFLIISRVGAEISVSINLGQKNYDDAKKYVQNAAWQSFIIGSVVALVYFIFSKQLVGFFNIVDPQVASDARIYLKIVSLSLPFVFLTNVIQGSFNASGNSFSTFTMSLMGIIINIILDPIMIFLMNLGINGAAYATIISQMFVFFISLIFIFKSKKRPFEKFSFILLPKVKYIKQLLKWGIPVGVENIVFPVLAIVTSRFEASFGVQAMAVGRIGSQIESITWLVGGGFGTAMTAFIGQNFGAGRWTRVNKGFKIGLTFMICYGTIAMLLLLFAAKPLFSIFTKSPTTVDLGAVYLGWMAFCQLFMCIEGATSSTFKGLGKTLPSSITSVSANVLRVIFAYVLSQTALGVSGVWLGISLAGIIRGSAILIWFLVNSRNNPKVDTFPQKNDLSEFGKTG